jgi:hypothetical protein
MRMTIVDFDYTLESMLQMKRTNVYMSLSLDVTFQESNNERMLISYLIFDLFQ